MDAADLCAGVQGRDTIGPDAFAPGTEYHLQRCPSRQGTCSPRLRTRPPSSSSRCGTKLKYVDVEITEGFVWPANGTKVATVDDGEVDVTHLRKWIIKHLKLGYTFPHRGRAIEAAWMSEAEGPSGDRTPSTSVQGETVAVFTSGNGVNVPRRRATSTESTARRCPTRQGFVWAGPYRSAKEHVDQVKCRLNVWKTMTSGERRNYNNAQIGVYANGTVAFVAKDEAYDAWSEGWIRARQLPATRTGRPRIRQHRLRPDPCALL